MKKRYPCLILTIMLLLSSGCSSRYDLDKPSLLLQYYNFPYSWGGIVLGQSTVEDTIEKLESMDFVEVDSIYKAKYYSDIDFALFLEFKEGYREDELNIWFIDGKAQVLVFSGYYTLAEIQENLGEVEKFVAYGWTPEGPAISYYGYSVNAGYVIGGSPQTQRNLDKLEEVVLRNNSIIYAKLINPDQLMYVLGVEMGLAKRDYVISEGAFSDWHDYGEYEVIRAKYDLFAPTRTIDE